jgi:DMSO/TMAO reductase YedYZ molybdopterin-dependent catalytic subunit
VHYGPVPRFRPEAWDLRVVGAAGGDARWDWAAFCALPHEELVADLHCVTRFTVRGGPWQGVSARTLLELAPPAPEASHVMVWAEYGYSANLPLERFAQGLLATHRNGTVLSPEHGYPVRLVVPDVYGWKGPKWVRGVEYLTADRDGFWESRGYHRTGDVWREQRYAYQEG